MTGRSLGSLSRIISNSPSSTTSHINTHKQWLLQVRLPTSPSAQQDTNDILPRRNSEHTTRTVGGEGLLQKVHRAEAPLKRRRRGQRCRSSTQSPPQQSDHEDAPRTRFLARTTRKASAKHHRWSWQTCQQQQLCKQRLEAARESAKYSLPRAHGFYWRWRILHWCSRGFSK